MVFIFVRKRDQYRCNNFAIINICFQLFITLRFRPLPATSGAGDVPDQQQLERADRAQVAAPAPAQGQAPSARAQAQLSPTTLPHEPDIGLTKRQLQVRLPLRTRGIECN